MPISNLCSKDVVCIKQSDTLQEAARLMKKQHIGGLVVVDDEDQPVGILTDRDITLTAVADNLPASTSVENAMSKNIVTVHKDEGISEVINKMEHEGVRRIIVVDENRKACGLVSFDDLVQLLAEELNSLGRLIQRQLENEKIYRPEARQSA